MRIVYIDELLLLNFAVDYIVLYLAAYFSALPYKKQRLPIGAAVGALYAAGVYFGELYGWVVLTALPVKLAAGAVIVLCAFGYSSRRALLWRMALFYIFSLLLGGIAYGLNLLLGVEQPSGGVIAAPGAVRAIVIASALGMGLCGMFTRDRAAVTASKVELRLVLGDRETCFQALSDSGNLLRDPLDGSPVVVAETDAVAPLFDRDTLGVLLNEPSVEAVAKLGATGRWRLIPCATAAGSALLAAFRPDGAYADGEAVRVMVAVSPNRLGALPGLVGNLEGAKIKGREVAGCDALGKVS